MTVLNYCTFLPLVLLIAYVSCAKYSVNTSQDLHSALDQVLPGDEIELNEPSTDDPDYPLLFGNFASSRNGTAEKPIVIYGRSSNVGLTTNASSFVPALNVSGDHWILKGFQITAVRSNGVALTLFHSHWTTVQSLEISASSYGIQVWGGQQLLIKNSSITSAYISIFFLGGTIPAQQNVKIIGNKITYSGYDTPNGTINAISIYVTYYQGSASSGLIEDNLFQWTFAPPQFWVFMGGSHYTIRNNTGSSVGSAGFYVTRNNVHLPAGTNNTFQTNHCTTVLGGYCIFVDEEEHIMDSTCISSDNSFDSARGLSNLERRCDVTCLPETVTTATTNTTVTHLHQCPGMVEITIITTTTTKVITMLT